MARAAIVTEIPSGRIYVQTFADLALSPEDADAILDPGERLRRDAFAFEDDRLRFGLAHAFMRSVLAFHVTDLCDDDTEYARAGALEFGTTKLGKPTLTNACPEFDFSMSRTKKVVAVAVSRNVAIGIDVEPLEHAENFTSVFTDYAFSQIERRFLDESLKSKEDALQLWTRKEAILKARGYGLRLPLAGIETIPSSETPLGLPASLGASRAWQVSSFSCAMHWVSVALFHEHFILPR